MTRGIHIAPILALALAAAAQTTSEKCRVEGNVVNTATGQPVRKAHVSLLPASGGEPLRSSTDAQGRFAFDAIAPGAYKLTAWREGYLEQRYGAKKPGANQKSEILDLAAGAVKSKIDIALTPLGSIIGHVRDENGDPVRGVEVLALVSRYGPGGREFRRRAHAETDASGEYRLFDLEPGEYYLRAKPRTSEIPGESYARVFYPGSPQASAAAAIPLSAGQEQRPADLVLHSLTTAAIRGRLVRPAGASSCMVEARDESDREFPEDDGNGFAISFGFGRSGDDDAGAPPGGGPDHPSVGKDGRFELRNVPVGSRTITAECRAGKTRYRAKLPIQLDSSGIQDLELRPLAPAVISGSVRIEGESKRRVTEARVWLEEKGRVEFLGAGDSDGKIRRDGSFNFQDLDPGPYHILVDPPEGLYLKSILSGSVDISASGLDLNGAGASASVEIVLSAKGGTIEGTVENGEGAIVVLIPADSGRARSPLRVTAGENGRFSFRDIAPGRYKLFAWEDVDPNIAMYDAEFRKPYEAKGEIVDIREKLKVTPQLKPIPAVAK